MNRPILDRLRRTPVFVKRWISNSLAGRLYIPKPMFFALKVTHRCTSRCVMCPIWEKEAGREPTLAEIQDIFRSRVLSDLQAVNLVGGEPTMRKDLGQIAGTIEKANPRIKHLGIITNALQPDMVEKGVRDILDAWPKGFSVSVSLDGYGTTHEKIRRVPDAFSRVDRSLRRLIKLQAEFPFRVEVICTVQKTNIDHLQELDDYVKGLGLPTLYNPVAHLCADIENYNNDIRPTPEQLKRFRRFIDHRLSLGLPDLAFWEDYFRVVSGKKRTFPCVAPYAFLKMTPGGDLYMCGTGDQNCYGNVHQENIDRIWYCERAEQLRKHQKKNACPTCTIANMPAFSLSYHPLYFLKFVARKIFGAYN